MALDREAISVALLAKLTAATTWGSPPVRRYRDLAELGNEAQPTAFLIDSENDTSEYLPRLALKWTLRPTVIVYARTDDTTVAPGTVTNALLLALEAALEDNGPGGKRPTTLGGLVTHCRIADAVKADGHQGGQAEIVLSLDILAVA